MNDKIRKTVPLVGALALTASALLAGSGAAFAGKTAPSADLNGTSYCSDSYVVARFDIDAKGRWVYLQGELRVDDEVEPLEWAKYNKNSVEISSLAKDPPQSATAKLWFGDRKNGPNEVPDWSGSVC